MNATCFELIAILEITFYDTRAMIDTPFKLSSFMRFLIKFLKLRVYILNFFWKFHNKLSFRDRPCTLREDEKFSLKNWILPFSRISTQVTHRKISWKLDVSVHLLNSCEELLATLSFNTSNELFFSINWLRFSLK